MASIPQIRTRLLEVFSAQQADLLAHVVIEAHDDLVNRADFHELTCVVKDLADSQKDLADSQKGLAEAQRQTATRVQELAEAQSQTATRVQELAEAQRQIATRVQELAEAQMQTETRVQELAEGQERLVVSQQQTQATLVEVVKTQQKMLTRLDRLDGHMLEDKVSRNLPAFLGREFRRCRVLERASFVEELEGRLPDDDLADLMRTDAIATARRDDEMMHLVVEASCTAAAEDLDRAARRAAALAKAGFKAIGIVACEVISPQTLAEARRRGLRVLAGGWLLPEAA